MFGLFSNSTIDDVAKCAQSAIISIGVNYPFHDMKKVTKTYLDGLPDQMLKNADIRSIAVFVLATEGKMLSSIGEDRLSKVFFDSIPSVVKELGLKSLTSKDLRLHDDDYRYIKLAKDTALKAGVEIITEELALDELVGEIDRNLEAVAKTYQLAELKRIESVLSLYKSGGSMPLISIEEQQAYIRMLDFMKNNNSDDNEEAIFNDFLQKIKTIHFKGNSILGLHLRNL